MKRLDRRALFSSGAAAALLAASGVSLDAAPRPGGRLRLALPREDDSLNRLVRGAVFDTLTEVAANGSLQGELATKWGADTHARTWRIELRPDVTFHDGRPLTVRDVIASLNTHKELGRLSFDTVWVDGAHRIVLELKQGNPGLPFLFAGPDLIICPDGQVDLPLDQAVGTGCYRTERLQSGRHYLGRKVAHHYKAGRAGWLDSIEALVIPDAAVRAEALRDGFVDVAVVPRPDDLRDRDDLIFHPSVSDMVFAAQKTIGMPRAIGTHGPLDDARLAERWWLAV
ncbi:ABC transporter substrate-binding protein [Sedimentitalea nanhaiensis]|uniref:Extracellular solute-binding protein, family 5 Middle n=1 Tax=Sedimentitalea nanhaiensis TaxID=999627 RepID=A0A1I7C9K1_9RHOB|nr:ABC transporter substrate-binding protein [Sedimentitalea nanhaiensis]SFT96073.1 extracellular solute-binding protein, family 5 Middle [Sedimentitalea nanhaiensis]